MTKYIKDFQDKQLKIKGSTLIYKGFRLTRWLLNQIPEQLYYEGEGTVLGWCEHPKTGERWVLWEDGHGVYKSVPWPGERLHEKYTQLFVHTRGN